jgi:hypothetical protein
MIFEKKFHLDRLLGPENGLRLLLRLLVFHLQHWLLQRRVAEREGPAGQAVAALLSICWRCRRSTTCCSSRRAGPSAAAGRAPLEWAKGDYKLPLSILNLYHLFLWYFFQNIHHLIHYLFIFKLFNPQFNLKN